MTNKSNKNKKYRGESIKWINCGAEKGAIYVARDVKGCVIRRSIRKLGWNFNGTDVSREGEALPS